MFVNNNCGAPQQCPVAGIEDSWVNQCPMGQQWMYPQTMGQYGHRTPVYPVRDPSVQCFYYPVVQQCYPPQLPVHVQRPVRNYPPMPNLPCKQQQLWDYDSMCYNVDGEPCQFTSVVDLEDIMNNDKRKEKSRVAARCRRNKEVMIFSELTAALPAKKEEVEQLDKASVMRLAIAYLKVRDVVSLLPEAKPEKCELEVPKTLEDVSSEQSYMKALDGFLFVLSQQGDIVYCSENIADHLGVNQMELMGQSVFEFSHPCEHESLREALRGEGARQLLLRLKCTLTGKGRNVYLKSASYKVVQVTGHMLTDAKCGVASLDGAKSGALIAVARPIPHPANIETLLDSHTFLSKHNPDMTFTYTDDALLKTLGFQPEELVGRSLYDYHHAGDSAALAQQFKSLFTKGQCETGQYRFLAKSGGYSWVQTQATLITDKLQKPVSVVCVNYVISGIECKDEVFAAHQLQHADLKPAVVEPVPLLVPPLDVPSGTIVTVVPPEEERPIPVTELIFAPRNKEMNKGFLMFSQDEGTMLKDEPEDLTHLAPTAGDACIPLENNVFEMLDEFILSDNYCNSFLGDYPTSGSPVDSLGGDPFLLSSPETQETDSSCEQSSLLTELSLDAFDSARSDDVDGGKSPFIPMSDELPLLEPAVMWGALPDNVSLAKPIPSEPQNVSPAPALQRLLAAPPTGPPPQDLITNIYSDQGLIPSRNISSWDTGVKRVIKQEEEPCAKRAKRSPSPVAAPRSQSSSVLMNLLDVPKPAQAAARGLKQMANVGPNYQRLVAAKRLSPQNLVHAVSRINAPVILQVPIERQIINPMSPLTLSVDSSMYGVYGRNRSPARELSPYGSPKSVSSAEKYQIYSPGSNPSGVLQSNSDPYLTNKSVSPSFQLNLQTPDLEALMDTSIQMSPGFWSDADNMIQDASDLLTAFDDVKL